ncbi:MAG: SBBP repeat-containing protein, partial [Ignavibacteriales bacterium]|nr:SBBP repeat-containing protein [Ignavibacteriales bacterium]
MKQRYFFLVLCGFLFFAQSFAQNPLWSPPPRYVGGGNGLDYPSAILTDGAGNVYVGGSTTESGSSNKDWVIMKYDASGAEVWARQFPNEGNDSLAMMKIDLQGNLYACGRKYYPGLSRHANVYTAKLNGQTGDILWDRNYSYRQTGFDEALALTLDDQKNVYVTGSVETVTGISDIVVIKYAYNSSGVDQTTYVWLKTIDGGTGSDVGTRIGITSTGSVYVGGYSAGAGSSFDMFTALLTVSGNSVDTAWTRRYTVPLYIQIDEVVGLAVDGNDNVIVTGISRTSDPDYRTIKYSPNGDQLWNVRFNQAFGTIEVPVGLVLDKANNVYVTGTVRTDIQKENIFTIKYNGATGDSIWTSSLNGPLVQSVDGSGGIFIGSDTSIYVCGFVTNDSANGYKNYYTAKINHNTGKKIWSAEFDGPDHRDDVATALAVDASGSVHLTGTSVNGDGNSDIMTQKFAGGSAITGRVVDDIDGDTSTTIDQIPLVNWKVYRFTTLGEIAESTATDESGFFSFLKLGSVEVTYDIMCDSARKHKYVLTAGIGGVVQQIIGNRTIRVTVDSSLGKGISIGNDFYSLRPPAFSTVVQESLVLLKSASFNKKKGFKTKPTWANVRDTAWVRTNLLLTGISKISGGLIVGVQPPIGTSYGWAVIEKKYKNG